MLNLCFVTDDGYAMPTCITINSILKNKNKDIIHKIYILCKDVSHSNKEKFLELNSNNFNIKIIDLDDKQDFSKYEIANIPATPTSIYKFFIPEILHDIDKVLYLDGDIIVKNDLKELYDLDIKENYVGAVKDTNGLDHNKFIKEEYKYFNSGVLLMNLSKMRKDKMSQKLLEYRKKGFNKLMDQDAFNYVLKNKVYILPFKFNTQMNTLSSQLLKNRNYTILNFKKYWNIKSNVNSIEDIYKGAIILHYTTAKPWKFYDGYGNDLWLEYYLTSPYCKERIYRKSFYISKLVNSYTYKLGFKVTYIFKLLKRIFNNKKSKKYKKFLNNFVNETSFK